MTLKELAKIKHPYYSSGSDQAEYNTFQDFLDEMKDCDIDLNLCYRFDVRKNEDNKERYNIELFTLLQRKGYIAQHYVANFVESDIPLLKKYMKPHMEKIKKIWRPF